MRIDLAADPAVIEISAKLDLDEDGIVGKLHRLWSWANTHTTNGYASGVTEKWIDRHVGVTGFASALAEAGWLVIRQGSISFPKFDAWNSKSAKTRLQTAKRMKRKRDADTVTEASPQNRREQKSKEEEKSLPPGGEAVDPPSTVIIPADPKPPPKRKPNPLFDAIAELSGLDPATAGGLIGKAAAAMGKSDPPYTPDDVREFGRRFWELCPYAARNGAERPTVGEIEKNIGLLRAKPPPRQMTIAGNAPPQRQTAAETQLDYVAKMANDVHGGSR